MKQALAIVMIVGFLAVDFFFFHDALKPHEVITLPQYLTGILSIPVMFLAGQAFLDKRKSNVH